MTIRIEKFFSKEEPELAAMALSIRREVFVVGQKVDPSLEYEFEVESHHYLLILDDEPVATARWRETAKGIKLERFATLAPHRGKGYGSRLLNSIMEDVLPARKKIYLHSQMLAVPFYENHGFTLKGEKFEEAGIAHYLMEYQGSQIP